jgi:hypothetical protein
MKKRLRLTPTINQPQMKFKQQTIAKTIASLDFHNSLDFYPDSITLTKSQLLPGLNQPGMDNHIL